MCFPWENMPKSSASYPGGYHNSYMHVIYLDDSLSAGNIPRIVIYSICKLRSTYMHRVRVRVSLHNNARYGSNVFVQPVIACFDGTFTLERSCINIGLLFQNIGQTL